MYFILKNPTTKNIFFIVFAVTSLFFAASMIRLLAIFAPAFAIIAAVGIMSILKPFYTLLKESPRTLAKTKRKLARVSKEYSGVAIFLIFLILVTEVSFLTAHRRSPKSHQSIFHSHGTQRVKPSDRRSKSSQPVSTWNDALTWMKGNLPANSVVVSWWDYGDWLSDIGNVTTLCDNTTYNATQIGNVGFIMMGNENQSMMMLNHYENYNNPGRVSYILVFLVLAIQQSSSGSASYTASPAGYGDEGKFVWMARISGTYEQMYLNDGYMGTTNGYQWKDETSFGSYSNQTGTWGWNTQGENCTINEIMYNAASQYCQALTSSRIQHLTKLDSDNPNILHTSTHLRHQTHRQSQYGGLIPLVPSTKSTTQHTMLKQAQQAQASTTTWLNGKERMCVPKSS